MIRGIGVVLILAVSGIIGFSMGGNVIRQRRIMRELESSLIRMRGEIRCRCPVLSELCRLSAEQMSGTTKQAFGELADRLEQNHEVRPAFHQALLRIGAVPEVQRIWHEVAGAFTRFDPVQLERVLDNGILQMEQLIQQAEHTCGQTVRLYRVLGICTGIVIVILLA